MTPSQRGVSEIYLLRAFILLMRERSVSRAAAALDLSQPAMSRLLGRMRVLFNDPLLIRSRSALVPTQRAMEIERISQSLVDAYDALVRDTAKFEPSTSQRTFTISLPEFAERFIVPPLLQKLRREAPDVRLMVSAPNLERGYEMLEHGEVDFRVTYLKSPAASLRSIPLLNDRLVCIADQKHPSIRGKLGMDEFLGYPHLRTLGFTLTEASRTIDAAPARSKAVRSPIVVQSTVSVPYALAGTDMIAVVPRLMALEFAERHALQVLEVPLRLPAIKYSAYWHERYQRDAGHRWLRDALTETGRLITKGALP